jgi:hypothetical protein
MLEKRYLAGKWIYRVPGALVWSYSRTDAGCLRRARPGTLVADHRGDVLHKDVSTHGDKSTSCCGNLPATSRAFREHFRM